MNSYVVKTLMFENKDKDKNFCSEDKDIRTRTKT